MSVYKDVSAPAVAFGGQRDREQTREAGYVPILKSSALMGGSSLLAIVIGLVRIKAIAVLLGPAGMGLWGIYLAIADLAQSLAELGVISSGIRQMAAASGTGDGRIVARTAWVLKRVSLLLGLFGATVVLVMSPYLADWSLGDTHYADQVAWLALAIVLRVMAEGQKALIQGLRRIDDLARMGVVVALLGAFSSTAWVYALGVSGIVPALITLAGITLIVSAWYGRKIKLPRIQLKFSELKQETKALLGLGLAFLASGLMVMGSAYLIRLMIVWRLDQQAAGFYQAAFALGGLYVGLVLQAMGSDYYPRLTALAHDPVACNRLVNQQTRVGLLLVVPGVLATLVLAPLVLELFYSAAFRGAVPLLRWLCVAMMFRVISWPLSFIMLAQGARLWFFGSESSWTLMYLLFTAAGLWRFGLEGVGMALLLAHALNTLLVYGIARRLSGFRWTRDNQLASVSSLAVVALVMSSFYGMEEEPSLVLGLLALLGSSVYVIRTLFEWLPPQSIPSPLARWLIRGNPLIRLQFRPVYNLGMLVLLSLWGIWFEQAYGWSAGLNELAVLLPAAESAVCHGYYP